MTMKAVTRKTAVYRPSRRLSAARSRSIQHYAARTGEIIWAWNHLHDDLRDLFWAALTPTNPLVGNAMWHALRSDSMQRALLRAVLLNCHLRPPPANDGILWLLDTIEKLAPHRNDLTHVPTMDGERVCHGSPARKPKTRQTAQLDAEPAPVSPRFSRRPICAQQLRQRAMERAAEAWDLQGISLGSSLEIPLAVNTAN
ncbi:MAG TPA: hypothetical protein VHZ29_04450 [Rhizomicrobium sp.]|nr:hypothetical protein [Rhizomicrobium sp.]